MEVNKLQCNRKAKRVLVNILFVLWQYCKKKMLMHKYEILSWIPVWYYTGNSNKPYSTTLELKQASCIYYLYYNSILITPQVSTLQKNSSLFQLHVKFYCCHKSKIYISKGQLRRNPVGNGEANRRQKILGSNYCNRWWSKACWLRFMGRRESTFQI